MLASIAINAGYHQSIISVPSGTLYFLNNLGYGFDAMRLGPIDFPDELITAQRDGNLVVFVGSGASRGAPSNLPTFEGLARRIAGGVYNGSVDGQEDQFLGRKRKEGVKVHTLAREILDQPSSKPNELHTILVKLVSNPGPPRIVTTNFDRHLSTAASEACHPLPEIFYAPALPLGSNFKGLVYLHGSVERDEDGMVLTDEDFGRAYLTEGWAARFLVSLFQSFTVLFVGYSHSDVIISYLARGLPPHAKPRFALTDQNDPRWALLGIVPIVYPFDQEHSTLAEGLAGWLELSLMGALDHEQRISKIVAAPPPLESRDADYIKCALQDPAKVQFFVRHARTSEWLDWCEKQECFQFLFQREQGLVAASPIAAAAAQLASWFSRTFVLAATDCALTIIQHQGKPIQSILWNQIAAQLVSHEPPPAQDVLAKWLAVLLPPPPGHIRNFLWGLLKRCRPLEDSASPLILLDHLTRPRLALTKRLIRMDEEPEFDWEVVLEGSDGAASGHELTEIWKDTFRPNLAMFAHGLIPFLTNRLRQVHLLFRSVGQAYRGWDPFSIRCQTIEHGDESYWDFGAIIDAARDVLTWLLSSDLNRAEQVIQEWISSEVPLLKRLGVYGLVKHPSFNADKKLDWILNANLIYAVSPDSEVTRLLESQYPEASNAVRERVIAVLRQTPAELGDTQGALLSYAVLTKLSHRVPSCTILQREINDILEKHPEFRSTPEKHPEFRSTPEEHVILEDWFSAGGAVAISQPSEVQRLLTKSPEQDLEELLAYVGER